MTTHRGFSQKLLEASFPYRGGSREFSGPRNWFTAVYETYSIGDCEILHLHTPAHKVIPVTIFDVSRKIRALENVKILIFPFSYALSMCDTFLLIIFSFTRTRKHGMLRNLAKYCGFYQRKDIRLSEDSYFFHLP